MPSLELESTIRISSAKRRLSRQESSTAAALRVISTAESGARVGAAKLLSRKIAAANSKWLCPTFKVLFVKTSSLGDVVHHLPAVSDAARELPGAEIDWVVEQPFAGVAAMHRAVRRVIPVALRQWRARWWQRATWHEIADFKRAVSAERYDAVLDTQSLVKSALIASCALGTRHGMDAASAREPLAARFYERRHPVPRGLHARLSVTLGARRGQLIQVPEDGLADAAELAPVEPGVGLAQPAPGHPRAQPQRVLQRVEGPALAGRRAADGAELRRDGPGRLVRPGDVRDEAGDGAGHRVGEPLLVVRARLGRVAGNPARDGLDHLRDGTAEPGPDHGRGLGGKRRFGNRQGLRP